MPAEPEAVPPAVVPVVLLVLPEPGVLCEPLPADEDPGDAVLPDVLDDPDAVDELEVPPAGTMVAFDRVNGCELVPPATHPVSVTV